MSEQKLRAMAAGGERCAEAWGQLGAISKWRLRRSFPDLAEALDDVDATLYRGGREPGLFASLFAPLTPQYTPLSDALGELPSQR